MGFNESECSTSLKNTGAPDCFINPGKDMRIAIVPEDFNFANEAEAKDMLKHIEMLNLSKAERGFIFPTHFNAEDKSEEKQMSDGWDGKKTKTQSRKEIIAFTLDETTLALHQRLKTFDNIKNYGVFIYTSENGLKATSSDGIKVEPFSLSRFGVDDQSFQNEDIARTIIEIAYENKSKEWDANGVYIQLDWLPLSILEGIKPCKIALVGAATATGATVNVTGKDDGVGFLGLVSANFNLYEDAAPTVPITVTVDVDNENGTYDLSWSSITGAHTIEIFNQPAGTSGIEGVDSAAIVP